MTAAFTHDEMSFAVDGATPIARPPLAVVPDPAPLVTLVTHSRPYVGESLATVLDRLAGYLHRYVWFPKPEQLWAVVLWIAHTFAMDAVEQSPILLIKSPVKQSGKSRLLTVIGSVVPRAWNIERPSEAVLYRRIHRDKPTILMDEADTIFEDKQGQYEGIRGIFNSGNRRGTVVSRAMAKGKTFDLIDFEIYCPKAIAGLGRFPETMVDRSIVISMMRRASGEPIERLRARQALALGEPIAEALKAALRPVKDLTLEESALPDDLDDRGQDNWESLIALADIAGGEWPAKARGAASVLNVDRQSADDNAGVTLLTDLRVIFEREAVTYLSTTAILDALHTIDASPWSEWRAGKPLSGRGLARLLRDFEITPDRTRASRGYSRHQFADAWTRYVQSPAYPAESVTSVTPATRPPGFVPGPWDPEYATDDDAEVPA